MPNEEKDKKIAFLRLMQEVVEKDNELRETHQIGTKFRFIRDRLNALVSHTEQSLLTLEKKTEEHTIEVREDEVLVYVYLFNAQGLVLKNWLKMLNPQVFYEYSINRPIYGEKSHVEAVIRGKTNKGKHGYITFAIKKDKVLPVLETDKVKDAFGNPVIKVKEGSLKSDRLISFTHNDQEYRLTESGELVRK